MMHRQDAGRLALSLALACTLSAGLVGAISAATFKSDHRGTVDVAPIRNAPAKPPAQIPDSFGLPTTGWGRFTLIEEGRDHEISEASCNLSASARRGRRLRTSGAAIGYVAIRQQGAPNLVHISRAFQLWHIAF